MKIALGNDHAAVEMKFEIQKYLEELGHEVVNFGTDTPERVDYPVIGEQVALCVAKGEADRGVLICGTGVGISLAANKVPGIRAAVCSDTTTAHLVREHNEANIIAFGARIVGAELAKDIVKSFLDAEVCGGRHAERVEMLRGLERKYMKEA